MKKIVFVLLSLIALLGCNQEESSNKEMTDEKETVEDKVQTIQKNDFTTFLGVEYGMEELSLENTLGKFVSGAYTKDSSAFIYYFNRIPRSPISVWVDSKTSKVVTIFMEVLSFEENFQSDLELAIKEFKISEEDSKWFGMTRDQIIQELGEPVSEKIDKEKTTILTYNSENLKKHAEFKIYPSQDNKCSSVSINWFYE